MALHNNQTYWYPEGWEYKEMWVLQGTVGKAIKVGCRLINGTTHKKPTQISVSTTQTDKQVTICSQTNEPDCWHNFTLTQTVEVVCLWAHKTKI